MRKASAIILSAVIILAAGCSRGGDMTPKDEDVFDSDTESETQVVEIEENEPEEEEIVSHEVKGSFCSMYTTDFSFYGPLHLGTDSEKAYFDSLISSLPEKTARIEYTYSTSVSEDTPITAEQCEEIITIIRNAPYSVYTVGTNPPAKGSCYAFFYDENDEIILRTCYNTEWFEVEDKNANHCVFDGTDCGLDELFNVAGTVAAAN